MWHNTEHWRRRCQPCSGSAHGLPIQLMQCQRSGQYWHVSSAGHCSMDTIALVHDHSVCYKGLPAVAQTVLQITQGRGTSSRSSFW